MPRSRGFQEAHHVAEVAGEGRQGLGDALLVTDVGQHPPEDRHAGAAGGRDPEAGLVHEGEQAQGLERDRLAAGVRAGDDQGLVAEPFAQAQVNGHRVGTKERMAGREQLDRVVRDRRPDRAQVARQSGAGHPQVGAGHCRQRRGQGRRLRLHVTRQGLEDLLLLLGRRQRRLGPRVVQLHHRQRLDEQGGGRRALVVDDPGHPSLGLGPDRDDVAPRALGDDCVPDGPGQLGGAEHRVQPLAHALLRDPHPAARGAQGR